MHHNKTEYMLSSLIKRNAGSNEPKSLRVGNSTFPENQPSLNESLKIGKTVLPNNQPSLNEWCKEFKVSSRVPKYSQFSHHG